MLLQQGGAFVEERYLHLRIWILEVRNIGMFRELHILKSWVVGGGWVRPYLALVPR